MVETLKNKLASMKAKKQKGFSLAELGIAMVIMLIIATIATISYFVFIDDAKNVKSVEDAGAIQTAVASIYAQEGKWGTNGELVKTEDFAGNDSAAQAANEELVFGAIGATLSEKDGKLIATNATNGLVVSKEALVDNDAGTVTTGNLTVSKADVDAITADDAAEGKDLERVKELVKVEKVDYNQLREYLGAGVTAEAVEGYFVVTVNHSAN